MEILSLKKADDGESIYSVLIDWLKKKNVQCHKLVGMDFDGAAREIWSSSTIKKNAPHAIFIHYHYHKFQLACVQAQTVQMGSNMFTLHSPLCGNSSIIPQRDMKISRRYRKH